MNIQIFKDYTYQGLCRAVDIFNFPSDYPTLTRILSYRFLFKYRDKDRRMTPSHSKIIESIKQMAIQHNNQNDATVMMELVDILLEYSKKEGQELLDYLRKSRLQAKPTPPKKNGPKGTIYADTQSVHNSAITKTIKQVAKYLCEKYGRNLSIIERESIKKEIKSKLEMNSIFLNSKDILEEVLERIYVDNAKFEGYNTDMILFSLWNWISIQKNDELYNRVAEELFEMHKYCSTRILSGLINSIQGFSDDPNMIIKMSVEEQCKSVVYSSLDKILKECEDERVLDGMIEKDKYFTDFIKEYIIKKREEWQKEYGDDFVKFVNKYVNMYSQIEIF